jgi:hypothetical protein
MEWNMNATNPQSTPAGNIAAGSFLLRSELSADPGNDFWAFDGRRLIWLAMPLRSVGCCHACAEPVEWVVAILASTTLRPATYDSWRTVRDAARTCTETSQRSGKGLRRGDGGWHQGD